VDQTKWGAGSTGYNLLGIDAEPDGSDDEDGADDEPSLGYHHCGNGTSNFFQPSRDGSLDCEGDEHDGRASSAVRSGALCSLPWLRKQRSRLSRSASVAEPIDYMLKRWDRFARFIGAGRICLSNNAAERALRGFALGRKSWLFAGSDRGADRAAIMATLIMTAKLNDIDPQAWLADVLARIAALPQGRLRELLPWNWSAHVRSVAPTQAA